MGGSAVADQPWPGRNQKEARLHYEERAQQVSDQVSGVIVLVVVVVIAIVGGWIAVSMEEPV